MAGVTREADHWHHCTTWAVEASMPKGGVGLDEAKALLGQRFAESLTSARRDPQHREIDTRSLLADWGLEIGLGRPEAWPIDVALDAFWREWVGVLDPIRGAAKALAELKRRGYRIGLVSNVTAPEPYALAELERLGIKPWLDHWTLSSVVGHRKPHPKIYESALSGIFPSRDDPDPGRVLFVGDGPEYDIGEPRRRGMKTALVRYDGLPWPAKELREACPDLRIDHVVELLSALPPLTDG